MNPQGFFTVSDDKDRITLTADSSVFSTQGNNVQPQVTLRIEEIETSSVNEIGVFLVDDSSGVVNGIAPGQPGYLEAVLNPSRSRVVFSVLPDTNELMGVQTDTIVRQLDFANGSSFGFYLVQDGTADDAVATLSKGQVPDNVFLAVADAGKSTVQILETGESSFVLAFEDTPGQDQQSFDDVTITLKLEERTSQLGTGLQINSELIDLRSLIGSAQASFIVDSKAVFDNTVGFYVVDDISGGIDTDGDGEIDLSPGDDGYAIAALQRIELSFGRNGSTNPIQIEGSKLLAPFIIADGTVDEFFATNPDNLLNGEVVAYFAFLEANPDGVDHIRLLGDNTFGFEDLPGGGDRDFNDIVFSIDLQGTLESDSGQVLPTQELPDGGSLPDSLPEDAFPTSPSTPLGTPIEPELTTLEAEFEAFLANGGDPTNFAPSNSSLQVSNGLVGIEVVTTGDANALLAELESQGLQNGFAFGSTVSGNFPIGNIDQLDDIDGIELVQPTFLPLTSAGFVENQADFVLRTNLAREPFPFGFGLDGTGITIGVISDSFNNLGSADLDLRTGDLPLYVLTVDLPLIPQAIVLQDLSGGGSDEGRAMMQLIHDIAPGANLLFHTGYGGEASFAQAILNLANAGADIIVDDLRYFAEPMFQHGLIAQAVETVVRQGVAYFTSAGNEGFDAYESPGLTPAFWVDGTSLVHDFNPGPLVDRFQSVTIPVGTKFDLSFQWDEPFFSLNPFSGGSQSDLNIYLFDQFGQQIVASSIDKNLGRDPVEILQFVNDGTFGTNFNLVIQARGGPLPNFIKYAISSRGPEDVTINEYQSLNPFTGTASGNIYGHANSPYAQAVGASPYFNPLVLEDFSSNGSTPIFFDEFGNPVLGPELPGREGVVFDSFGNRLALIPGQPRVVAPNNTNTTFFGQDIFEDFDLFPNFAGTSASAPHAAAVAALMMDVNPRFIDNPFALYGAMEASTFDMDDPSTFFFDFGPDFASGFGFLDGFTAVNNALFAA